MPSQKSRVFIPFLAGYYFFYFSLIGVYIIFIPKALLELNYTTWQVGVVYAAAPLMRFILPFLFRHYISLNSKIFISSLFLILISSLIFLKAVNHFESYFIANLLFGAAIGVSLPYVESISLSTLSKNTYGRVRLWGSIGFITIALLLGKFIEEPNEILLILCAVALMTLVFGTLLVPYDKNKNSSIKENSSFSLSKYWAFWLSMILMQIGFGGFYNFFTIYETSHGISIEIVSWMWSFGVLCEIVMLYFQGPLLQKNLITIIKIATLITAGRWLMLYLYPDSIPLTFASQALHAFSFALYHTAAMTYVYSLYTQKKLAQQFFLGISFGLGASIGAILSGKIYGEHMFLIESIITIFAFIALIVHESRVKNREKINET